MENAVVSAALGGGSRIKRFPVWPTLEIREGVLGGEKGGEQLLEGKWALLASNGEERCRGFCFYLETLTLPWVKFKMFLRIPVLWRREDNQLHESCSFPLENAP